MLSSVDTTLPQPHPCRALCPGLFYDGPDLWTYLAMLKEELITHLLGVLLAAGTVPELSYPVHMFPVNIANQNHCWRHQNHSG